MNHVSLIGRIARDVELRSSTLGKNSVFMNSIAIQSIYRTNEGYGRTNFIPIIAFDKMAERIARFVHKGDRVGIEGSLRARHYVNKKDQDVYTVEVIVEEVFFLEPKEQVEGVGKDVEKDKETEEFESIFKLTT